MHAPGAEPQKTMHRPYKQVGIGLYLYLKFEKVVHLPGAHLLKSCTRRQIYADPVQGYYVSSEFVQISPIRPPRPPGALRAGREGSFLWAKGVL